MGRRFVVLSLGFAGALSLAAPALAGDEACVLAVLSDPVAGETVIDDRDADALRALLQPPPGRDAARRLAVDAALAHLWLRGWVAPASARGRIAAWRALLEAVDTSAVPATEVVGRTRDALMVIGERAGLIAGPCLPAVAAARAAAASAATPVAVQASETPAIPLPTPDPAAVLSREKGRATLLRLEIGADDCHTGFDLGLVPASHLDGDLARAALTLRAGAVSAPIDTRFGARTVRVLERVDPTSAGPDRTGAGSRVDARASSPAR